MTTIQQNCKFCQEVFFPLLKEVKRGNGKFCSTSCRSKFTKLKYKPEPNNVCAYCNIPIYRGEGRANSSRHKIFFCCREHKDISQRIGGIAEIMPAHYGSANVRGYRLKAIRSLKNECVRCGWDKVPEILEVNHIDCDRSNNDITNLEILCPTCHSLFHFETKTGYWKTRAG